AMHAIAWALLPPTYSTNVPTQTYSYDKLGSPGKGGFSHAGAMIGCLGVCGYRDFQGGVSSLPYFDLPKQCQRLNSGQRLVCLSGSGNMGVEGKEGVRNRRSQNQIAVQTLWRVTMAGVVR
ncbi:hypothetical protein GGR55DRAFT_642361, partial [Xylaria sp. FL0064]